MPPGSTDNESSLGLTKRLRGWQAGQLDQHAVESLFAEIHAEALKIARAQQRRRGSPDGVAGASDLANSQAARIWRNPAAELQSVATTDDLRRVLQRMLLDLWIQRRRKEQAEKRGGGKVIAASQWARDDERRVDADALSPPDAAEVTVDLADLCDVFPADSQERGILELLLAGNTQAEIGEQLGLSRDAVGRRIRQTIAPTLARRMKAKDDV